MTDLAPIFTSMTASTLYDMVLYSKGLGNKHIGRVVDVKLFGGPFLRLLDRVGKY